MVELFVAGFYRPDADSGQESGSPVTRPSTPHVSRVERASQPGPLGQDLRTSPLTRFDLSQPHYVKDIEKRFPVAPTQSRQLLSDRIAGLLCAASSPIVTIQGDKGSVRRAGLLDEASVEPDKHISMHPALRVSIVASGKFAALSRAGEARFTG